MSFTATIYGDDGSRASAVIAVSTGAPVLVTPPVISIIVARPELLTPPVLSLASR